VVASGIKVVVTALTKHIPSHITIAGYRVLKSYEGQPQTCFGCGDTGHIYQVCPKRRGTKTLSPTPTCKTWAHITANGTPTASSTDGGHIDKAHYHKQPEQALVNQMENDIREPRPLPPPSSSVTCTTDTP